VSLRARIFLVFIACVTAGFGWLVYWVNSDLRARYGESFEEVMVDSVNMLAEQLAEDWPRPPEERFRNLAAAMSRLEKRGISAQIYSTTKTSADLRVYVTDAGGHLLYHSRPGHTVGEDFSHWIDIRRTLAGSYGARTSDEQAEDAAGQLKPVSVAYVAAPIYVGSERVGVVSLGKPKTNIARFLDNARRQLRWVVLVTALAALTLALQLYLWLTRPLQQLEEYAHSVSRGEVASLPDLGDNEVGRVGEAMESMRRALEDKAYVESYIQSLTHEIKSPLTAIRASAELLAGDVTIEQRTRFTAAIEREATRLNDIADRVLQLATLERARQLDHAQQVSLFELATDAAASASSAASARGLSIRTAFSGNGVVTGDRLLLRQAIDNLVRNAADFSPDGGSIAISGNATTRLVTVTVQDEGPGIPAYALERVFDRFYSLPRPHTGRKSTGLGLNFVREVAQLHGGQISIECPGTGTTAHLRIPRRLLRR
jgi:two-component system, OmpR family, sensor histidine kinase CreC